MMLGRVNTFLLTMTATLAPALAWAEPAAHGKEEGGSAMPQLDPTYFASQLFWLLICGVTLYVLMAKLALPRVARMVDMRDDQVRHDLEKAAQLRHQAEDVKLSYTRALRDADERARALIERTIKEIRAHQAEELTTLTTRITKQTADTETRLAIQTQSVLEDVSEISTKLSGLIVQELTAKAA